MQNKPNNIPQMVDAPASKPRAKKLTLIEVIIGALLMATCVIVIAAIYAQRTHDLRGGKLHATAAELSDQMATLIRGEKNNSAIFETGLGHACNVAQALPDIENEVACWQEDVARELSNGSARIVLDNSTVPAQYIITISWTDPRSGTASYVQRVSVPDVASVAR